MFYLSVIGHSEFNRICISAPHHIYTRVRQEKGQDIAGACGQLALVNPGKASAAASSKDIEDVAGDSAKSSRQGRIAGSARTQRSMAIGSTSNSGATVEGIIRSGAMNLPRSTLLCYANVLIPVVVAAVGLMKQL